MNETRFEKWIPKPAGPMSPHLDKFILASTPDMDTYIYRTPVLAIML